ncbi:unnamed protein product [Leptidea sinapis]|uniref:DUF3730 domain-containing protein n=1 Tax=Leptidea sinapis TaxID=189913 RepID=A0A5E4R3Y4_9NEOP|nr:unnamed protein product [Leptidea sinapis]
MDEIEYKLKTNTTVLIVNAIDKLIFSIQSKYKPADRQKFILENEELKFLRLKCSSPDPVVSLTACQGLLSLVELNILEIAHTMSTVVSLLPTAHNFSAIVSTMAGLLVLDLRPRLRANGVKGYQCPFSLRSPQHPFITVLEKNKQVEDDIFSQMHALCVHPDSLVSRHSPEMLRPVFLWLTCNPKLVTQSTRPWQLLLSLPESKAQSSLLMTCISCQQVSNPQLVERALAVYLVVADVVIYQQQTAVVVALLPLLARLSAELLTYGRDPRSCYALIKRCFGLDAAKLKCVSGPTLMLLAENLSRTPALYLYELLDLCLNIITKHKVSNVYLNSLVALSLQWLHRPSVLTTGALEVASKILSHYESVNGIIDINCSISHREEIKIDNFLYFQNLKSNSYFQNLVFTDGHLKVLCEILHTWERVQDNPAKLRSWLDNLEKCNSDVKFELLSFFVGLVLEMRLDEELVIKAIRVVVEMVGVKKELSVTVLPMLVYKMGHDPRPAVKLECLRGIPVMAARENVPVILSLLNKLNKNEGLPTSLLIKIYASLAEQQARCFPYLQELLANRAVRSTDSKWEIDIAIAIAVKRLCDLRPLTDGVALVSVISSLLNRCTDQSQAVATCTALEALGALWRSNAVAPPGTWRALEPRLGKDRRPTVQISLCKLLSEIPALRVATTEFDQLVGEGAARLWRFIAEAEQPAVIEAACRALAHYRTADYQLKHVPEIYRQTVKLPPSYCKTPIDAARRPEDVLDYIPCEVWPEVFKFTNQSALNGVQHLVSRLMEREIRSYRAGVYQLESGREPQTASKLPASSVVRGIMDFFRKHTASPSYDISEAVLLSMLHTLCSDFPKPLPPMDLCFVHELVHRGSTWRAGCLSLASRQALASPSAKRLESEVTLLFDNLAVLCRTMPPNSVRPALERCLADAHAASQAPAPVEDLLFVKQLRHVWRVRRSTRPTGCCCIWAEYVSCCGALPTKYLERMTSPSGWWEVSGDLVRKCVSVRSSLAALTECTAPLLWLNEAIDVCATQPAEQEFSLRHIMSALRASDPDSQPTKDWFLQLMARAQVAFSDKLYICDVFMVAVIVLSGGWSFEPDVELVATSRQHRYHVLPAALYLLLARDAWKSVANEICEWVCHTREATRNELRNYQEVDACVALGRSLLPPASG